MLTIRERTRFSGSHLQVYPLQSREKLTAKQSPCLGTSSQASQQGALCHRSLLQTFLLGAGRLLILYSWVFFLFSFSSGQFILPQLPSIHFITIIFQVEIGDTAFE